MRAKEFESPTVKAHKVRDATVAPWRKVGLFGLLPALLAGFHDLTPIKKEVLPSQLESAEDLFGETAGVALE
jgi:hypothetical protein